MRHLIIGHGIAGLAAARAIRRRQPEASIGIITDEHHRFYSRPGLAYYLSGDIPERQLFSVSDGVYQRMRCSLIFGRVTRIDPHGRRLLLADGSRLAYDRLLLAVGARAVVPKMEGVQLEGVVTLDSLDDARHIRKLARRARRAVVIGGGITALEIAEGLAAQKVETHYLMRKDHYWSSVLDPTESAIVEANLTHEGVVLHRRTEVEQIIGRGGRLQSIHLSTGERLRCSILGIAIGIRPRLELTAACGLEVDRGVLVDEHMRASLPGVFAAGDVAQVYDPEQDAYRLDSLWWTAEQQGHTAGANMADDPTPYLRKIPFNVTRIGGKITTIIGSVGSKQPDADLLTIMRGDSENWRHSIEAIAIRQRNGADRIRLMVGHDRIVGAIVMGDQGLSRPLQRYIQEARPLGHLGPLLRREPQAALDFLRREARPRLEPTAPGVRR